MLSFDNNDQVFPFPNLKLNYSIGTFASVTTHPNLFTYFCNIVQMENKKKSSYLTKEILKNNTANGESSEVKFLPSVVGSLKNIAAKEGFISYKISHSIISNNGSSYLGDLYEVDIKGETKDGLKEIQIFLKHVIPGEALKSLVDVKSCYSHEVLFYTDLSTIFNILQENANVPEGERLKMVKSYQCISDAIILENLATKGFKTLNRMDVMTLKFAELSIAELAKLNGLSFVLKHKMRDYFENKIKSIKSSLVFDDITVWKNYANKMFDTMTTHLNSDTKQKIDYFRQNSFYEKFPKYFTGDTDSVKCMCHGDFRLSNVMFKEINEEETEAILIDYQFLFYGSPMADLFYFIYLGTDRKFRKAHMNNLKDLYHDKLTEFLKYFDLDINDVYPKKVYEKDFKDSLEFGLMVALYISPIIFTIAGEVPDFGKLDNRYKERIAEVVEEYVEWGILK